MKTPDNTDGGGCYFKQLPAILVHLISTQKDCK